MSNPTKIKYRDYDGPQRGHAIIDGEYVLCTPEIARDIALNAHLLALGDPERAAEMLAEAELAGTNGSNGSSARTVA
jgi:hypothetical protein